MERLNAMHATSTRLPTVRQEALAEFLEGGQAACLPASTARTRIEQVARFGSAPRTARGAKHARAIVNVADHQHMPAGLQDNLADPLNRARTLLAVPARDGLMRKGSRHTGRALPAFAMEDPLMPKLRFLPRPALPRNPGGGKLIYGKTWKSL